MEVAQVAGPHPRSLDAVLRLLPPTTNTPSGPRPSSGVGDLRGQLATSDHVVDCVELHAEEPGRFGSHDPVVPGRLSQAGIAGASPCEHLRVRP
jgi:hypothetical protein